MKLFSSNFVRSQLAQYGGAAKITLFVKFKIVAIWTKFDVPIQNEMPTTIRK